ncbi:MAG TPA: 50S ribosomal protein L24 [Candidatus Krumholzibacterium sp.]|nr:50S ribosomal protein L24 [Candidatus Krumholzibacterium sp.]
MRIKKNDTVKVIAGNSKGLEGKVLKVFPDSDRVIVEKVKMIKRHTRQTGQGQQGGIVEKEAPIDISNVILVCPKCGKPARTGMAELADGRKVRKCKKCNETLADDD